MADRVGERVGLEETDAVLGALADTLCVSGAVTLAVAEAGRDADGVPLTSGEWDTVDVAVDTGVRVPVSVAAAVFDTEPDAEMDPELVIEDEAVRLLVGERVTDDVRVRDLVTVAVCVILRVAVTDAAAVSDADPELELDGDADADTLAVEDTLDVMVVVGDADDESEPELDWLFEGVMLSVAWDVRDGVRVDERVPVWDLVAVSEAVALPAVAPDSAA